MSNKAIPVCRSVAGFLILASCFACNSSSDAKIEDLVAQFVPQLHLGMPLDSATKILTDVRAVEYWGHLGTLAEVQDFPRVGVRAIGERAGRARVGAIHMFSPQREIVPQVVRAISSAARVPPKERCTGMNNKMTVYIWQVDGGRILLTDNKAAVPGGDPVHLWFVTPDADQPLTYSLKRCK
jgi:hypothetical protein